ncbi:MAG: flavoprotein [Candidatus Aegiribacteria sp.]|nr:flavoprotein [Candidatus Aegiribacteria sp.]
MNERILLGITASAAAFKGVALASLLRKEGYEVDGILSMNALKFVSDTQLACVTGRPVFSTLFTDQPGDPVPHISLTEECSLLVVVPATADYIAKTANGIADDLLTSVFLANEAPVVMAPSMNTRMWCNPATVENVSKLRNRGITFAGPLKGRLACGTMGEGRMMEPVEILSICLRMLSGKN